MKTTEAGGERGWDGGKLTGRKRHILVDTLGLLLRPAPHRAHRSDETLAAGDQPGETVECGGFTQQVWGRRITLCAGALVSPLLLMRSGIGPHATLVAHGITPLVDLPGVGANLVDHPWAPLILVPRAGVADLTALPAAVGLRYTTPGSGDFNDMQMYFNAVNLQRWPSLQALVHEPLVLMFRPALQRPQSRGRLTLTTADPHSPPTIAVNCLAHPEDLRRMVAGLRLAWTLACSPQLRPFVERIALSANAQVASDEALVAYLRRHSLTVNHPAGTARMGPRGDADAVVDQKCQVYGVEQLRVVDASVMPTIPRANINLTCIMIAERVADWMRAAA